MRLTVLLIFAATYAGVAIGRIPGLKLNRVGIALLGAIGMMLFGGVRTSAVIGYVNWPTILMLFGFFVISAQLRMSGFYDRVAGALALRLEHPAAFLFALMAGAAVLSSFLNHDIVCFVFAPIVGAALLRKGLNPVPFLVALAIASNIGAAATLIGNPQDMMIGQVARLGFGRYIAWSCIPVAFAFASSYGIIWYLSRASLRASPGTGPVAAPDYPFNLGHTVKGLVILAVVVGLLFSPLPMEVVALAAAGIHLASRKYRTEDLLGLVDWPILILFAALFVVTGAFQSTGYGETAVRWLSGAGVNLAHPATLALATAGLSNLVGNAAAVMLLLKVVPLAHPETAYVLALANSFGGSLILIGSVSNIIVAQQARGIGVNVSFREFARLGVPVTLVAIGGLVAWVAIFG